MIRRHLFFTCECISGKYKLNITYNITSTINLLNREDPLWGSNDDYYDESGIASLKKGWRNASRPSCTNEKKSRLDLVIDHEYEHVNDMEDAADYLKNEILPKMDETGQHLFNNKAECEAEGTILKAKLDNFMRNEKRASDIKRHGGSYKRYN